MKTLGRMALVAAIAVPLVIAAGLLLPKEVFYRDRRPTRFGRAANGASAWLAARWLPMQLALEVRGRVTGRPSLIVLVPVTVRGQTYLVSMLGEASDWVKNARADGGRAVVRSMGRREVLLVDVPVPERAPILKAYVGKALGARRHFPIGPSAPLAEFARIAAEYPVFQIVPAVRVRDSHANALRGTRAVG